MSNRRWAGNDEFARVENTDDILAEIEAAQPDYPGMWGEVRRYASPATAGDRAYVLRKKYPEFRFRSSKDADTGEGVVWAMFMGGDDG